MNKKVIQSTHIYILIIMSTGFMVHVLLHPVVLTSSRRDSWVSIIGSIVPFIIWTLIIYFVYKKFENKDIFALLHSINPFIKYGICIFFAAYFFMTAFITFNYTFNFLKVNYAYDLPNFFIVLPLLLVCFFASYKGIRVISTMAFLLLPAVSMFGVLVAIGNMKYKDYTLLLPIFENGYKDFFRGIIYTCSSFFEIIYFLFLVPFMKDRIKAKWLLFTSIVIFILALGPLVGGIAEFGAEEARNFTVPAFSEWKLVTVGIHITRLDFLAVFQWLSGAFIRVSLSLFIAKQLFSNKEKNKWVLPILYVLLMVSVLIPWDFDSFYYFLYRIYFPVSMVFLFISLGLFLLLSRIKGSASQE
ncbi:endospore germination permease [Bacillus xiapuensis]|uniref:Endospore germination permease n=1 Tax=Bacillus xiapuensis TaxID=2014075 RepID=A0ABU6N7E7_9BACI|nr:endospore germination permease [Bacillus xiapuensis]